MHYHHADMNFSPLLTSYMLCLVLFVSQINAVRTYNALTPANVLLLYRDENQADRLLLVELVSSDDSLKLQATGATEIQEIPLKQGDKETEETQQIEGGQRAKVRGQRDKRVSIQRSELQNDNEPLLHGKEFIKFIRLFEATILHGPEDVECYFFYITLDERVQPEQSFIKYSKPLRFFRRFSFGKEPLQHVMAVECEGSVNWGQKQS